MFSFGDLQYMALIDHIDGPNRDIYLSIDTVNTSIHPIDIYKEMRVLRKNNEALRKYDVFLSAFGNVPKGGGKYTERYVVENSGTRIIPYDSDHFLTITGTIITDDGGEGIVCFNREALSASTVVDLNYVPPQVEIITVNTGSGVSSTDVDDIASAVWNEALSSHEVAGSAGAQLSLASSGGVDYDSLAEAVWDRDLAQHTGAGSAGKLVKETNDVETGNWKIVNNQMIFKDKSGTELFRVNLFNEAGLAASDEVFERVRA